MGDSSFAGMKSARILSFVAGALAPPIAALSQEPPTPGAADDSARPTSSAPPAATDAPAGSASSPPPVATDVPPGPPASSPEARLVGLELNVLWPFIPGVGIYQLRGTVKLWETAGLHGDLVLATNLRPPIDEENAGSFSEYGGGLGYRQYFWRGLHLELAGYPSYVRLDDNVIDGTTYESFALTLEAYAGYRFLLSELGLDEAIAWPIEPLINVQVGAGGTAFLSNPWPVREEEPPVFFVGSVLIGAAF